MKRVMLFAIVLLVISAGTASAQTQESMETKLFNKVSVDFQAASIPDILRTLCAEQGLICNIGNDVAGQYSGSLKDVTVLQALRTIASSAGYALELQGSVITIRGVTATESTNRYRSQVEEIMQRYPQAYAPGGIPQNFDQLNAMHRELYALQQSAVPQPIPQPAYVQPSYRGQPPPAFTYGYAGQPSSTYGFGYDAYGYLNPFAIRDFSNTEKYGLLKIDGPDRFLRSVRVVIDGRDATVASKANNAWNKPIILTAGPHIVEFVRETDDRPILAFRRDVEVVPISVQLTAFGKPEPVWLRVTGNEFENAREIYEYRQHRYVEQVDGSTTQRPATPAAPVVPPKPNQ